MARVSHKKLVERARKAYDKLTDRVYACAPNNTTPFSDCLELAPADLRDAFDNARRDLITAECAAVSAGKARHGTYSMLHWYR